MYWSCCEQELFNEDHDLEQDKTSFNTVQRSHLANSILETAGKEQKYVLLWHTKANYFHNCSSKRQTLFFALIDKKINSGLD